MRLVHSDYGIEIEFVENQIMKLTVEHPVIFSNILSDLWNQINGESGNFVLSEVAKIYNISKEADFIINPFALDCNNKKIITKLYKELTTLAQDELYIQTAELNTNIVSYIDKLTDMLPYHLNFNLDIDISSLLKSYNVAIDSESENLMEHFIEYLRAMHQICGISIFIAINLKQYFDKNQLESLYEFIFYEKINLLIIEGTFTEKNYNENCLILDIDNCIIQL